METINPTFFTMTDDERAQNDKRAADILLRKIDLKLLPLLMSLYFFSYLDRINIGNARLFGLEKDLNMTSNEYNWTVSVFFFLYVLFEIPSNMVLRKIGPSKWISFMMFCWGTVVICMMSVRNFTGLLIARLFLGLAESGFFPGIIFYLTLWYIRRDQAFRMAMFYSSALLAGAFGGIMAYGMGQLDNVLGLKAWQWIFLIEGSLTVILAFVTFKFLADYPATVKWLNQVERDMLTTRLRTDSPMAEDTQKLSIHQIKSAFKDWKIYLYIFINIGALTPVYGLSIFLPSIIKNMGYEDSSAQLLTIPPYCLSCATTIAASWNAGRLQERSNHILIFLAIGIGAFLYLIFARSQYYPAACIACIGVFSANALVLSWLTNNIVGQTKRAIATAMVVAGGNFGGMFSGQIYQSSDEPYYRLGHSIVLGLMCMTFILVFTLKFLLVCENRRRGRRRTVGEADETADVTQHLLNEHPDFVYVT